MAVISLRSVGTLRTDSRWELKGLLCYFIPVQLSATPFKMWWAGETIQWLKTPAASLADLGSIPNTHITTHSYNSTSKGSDVFFWPLHTRSIQTNMQAENSDI